MLRKKWIPTRLVTRRSRPVVHEVRKPSRARPVILTLYMLRGLSTYIWLRLTGRATPERLAALTRSILEGLGGLWVKIGQLLSMRRDLFSDAFCDALAALQDHATGFPFHHTRRILAEDLELPIDRVFEEFDEEPFAAASIGQIYRARLRHNGVDVAVKIRRPTVARLVAGDIRFVWWVTRIAELFNVLPSFRWDDFYWELDRTLSEELDYRYEANYIRRMRKSLKAHGIYVPKVFQKFSAKRVLVMEFVTGVLMSDVLRLDHSDPERLAEWMDENNVERTKVGKRLTMSLNRQIFEDNLFHGDLHPGNIVLLRDSRIALIDFGSVGWLDKDFLDRYDDFLKAMAMKEYGKAADLFLLLSPDLPDIDLEPVRRDLKRFMRSWAHNAEIKAIPFGQKSIGYGYSQIARIFARHRIPTAWAFLRINRAEITLDTSLRELYPQMDYFKTLDKYLRKREIRSIRREFQDEEVVQRAAVVLTRTPRLVEGLLEQSGFELEWMRRRARVFQGAQTKLSFIGSLIASFVFVAAVGFLLGQVVIYGYQRVDPTLFSEDMQALLAQVPIVPYELWAYVIGFWAIVCIQVLRVFRRLRQPEASNAVGPR